MTETREKQEETGIRCPECGGPTRAPNTKKRPAEIIRYRKCIAGCKGPIVTRERMIGDSSSVSATKIRLSNILSQDGPLSSEMWPDDDSEAQETEHEPT